MTAHWMLFAFSLGVLAAVVGSVLWMIWMIWMARGNEDRKAAEDKLHRGHR